MMPIFLKSLNATAPDLSTFGVNQSTLCLLMRFPHSGSVSLGVGPILLFLGVALLGGKVWANDEKAYFDTLEPILLDYCYDCHGDGMDKGDFALDDFDSLSLHLQDMAVWFEVWKQVRANLMPPPEKPQLDDVEKEAVLAFIESAVFKIDPENPDPGRVTIRRLNREEYRNTIKDLMRIDYRVEDVFPVDDTGYGFDTIGDVLSISPLLMEKYLEAAQEIVDQAVPLDGPQILWYWADLKKWKGVSHPKHTPFWFPMKENRVVEGSHWVPKEGDYEVMVEFEVRGSSEATQETGTLKLAVDGQQVGQRNVGWDQSRAIYLKAKARLKEGSKSVFTLTMEPGDPPDPGEDDIAVRVKSFRIYGPLDGSVKDYPWESRHIFSEGPAPDSQDERDVYREKILRKLATQAFRRPVDDATVDRLVKLARQVDEQPGKRFEHGIAHAITAILVNPRFLMRAEIQPEPNNPGKVVPVDEFALASRLSYFLWLSMPDEELMKLASEKKLRANLRAQVDRMLADEKSDRFISSFIGQWLQARDVETINIDARRVLGIRDLGLARRTFSGQVRQSMRAESESLFGYVLKENLPPTTLLTADFTFLNQPLAEWYGIPGVEGNHMRKVDVSGDPRRGGILKQGTFQVVTSNPTRTSPVKRGLFVLENLLATPAPSAVPDVPPLEETLKGDNRNLSLREALALHSEQKLCASCHSRMDPIGLALENYNPAGLWIDEFKGQPLDTQGELVTGEKFANAHELSQVLASTRGEDFHRALTEKLLTFALGRGIEFYDAPTVDSIVERVHGQGAGMKELLYSIVESAPFQKRRGDGNMLADRD